MENIADAVRTLRSARTRAVVARAITMDGFGSRRMGDAAILAGGSPVAGQVLNGGADEVLERETARLLAGDPAATVVEVRLADGPAVAAGLACGGAARLLIQDIALIPAAWWEAIDTRRPAALITTLPDGASTVITDASGSHRASALLARRAPATEVEGDEVIEVWWPTPRVLVLGAAELAGAIARQSELLGWDTVLDEGSDPAASTAAAADLGPADALVVLSHNPLVAIPALAASLTGDAGYVGALGSRTTQANRRTRLLAAGLTDGDVDRIHGPVGLDLGARTPEETAVAICAEVIAQRSGRAGASLRDAHGPING